MQQFGPQFVNSHLVPLLEKMLSDAALSRVPGSEQSSVGFLDKLFIVNNVSNIDLVFKPEEIKMVRDRYFNVNKKEVGVPFAGTGSDEEKEQNELLTYCVQYMSSHGGKQEDRQHAFMPVISQQTKGAAGVVVWPAEVKRNVFMMSYHIAESFQKAIIGGIITQKEKLATKQETIEEAKRDRELFEKGQLILVKDPATGEFTKYIRATELKPGETAIQFLPPATGEAKKFMQLGFIIPSEQNLAAVATSGVAPQPYEVLTAQGSVSPQATVAASTPEAKPAAAIPDQVSSNEELTQSFQENRGKAMIDELRKQGFQIPPNAEVQFDNNNHAFIKVKSGNDTVLISADMRVLPDQDLKLTITFQDGPRAGKSLTIEESKLPGAFNKEDGTKRTAGELYDDQDLCKKMNIQRDAVPQQAPGVPQPTPNVGMLQRPSATGVQPFKIGTGALPGQIPLGAGEETPAGMQGTAGGRIKLPPMVRTAGMPQPMQRAEEGPGATGVTGTRPSRPIPGIPKGPSPMANKAGLKERQQQEAEGGEPVTPGEGIETAPLAPGRIRTPQAVAGGGGGKKPGNAVATAALWGTLGGIGAAGGTGLALGGAAKASPAALEAFKIINTVLIALGSHLHRFFG